jgi:hypothetical protein
MAGAGLVLAASISPLGPWLTLLLACLGTLAQRRWPQGWLFFLPALLPVVDLVPLSGNMLLTEADQLILVIALVGYTQLALGTPRRLPYRRGAQLSLLSGGLVALLTLSYAVGAVRGFLPYAPMDEQLAGYHSRWNALRVGKGFFLPLLLMPLLIRALREDGMAAVERLAYGLVAGLGGVSLFALWERLAYTGLMNFSSDYRITASFWEMNVGGAALDGWLALTLPFSVWAVMRSRRLSSLIPFMALAGLAFYVALVTFSRGVYAACFASALVWAWVWLRAPLQEGPAGGDTRKPRLKRSDMFAAALLLGMLSWGMWLVFHTGGYRTLGAIVVLVPATHLTASAGHRARPWSLLVAALVWVSLLGIEAALFLTLEKGSYLAFGLATVLFAWAALSWMRRPTAAATGRLIGLWFGMAMAAALVALHWGEMPALLDCLRTEAAMALVLLLYCLRPEPLGAWQPRSGFVALGASAALALAVAVPGGYYMGSRFSSAHQDMGTREKHWTEGMSWLDTPADWIFGKGLGRFPEVFYWKGSEAETPGVHAFPQEAGQHFLRLVSARHSLSWGNVWRLLQPVPVATSGPLQVFADVRAHKATILYFEICQRHLLYAEACTIAHAAMNADPQHWKAIRVVLAGAPAKSGPWYAPRISWFSVALLSSGGMADIDKLRLVDASGRDLLRNGDFSAAGDFWFSSSDRDHLPWHIKNVFLNMYFDQGLLGVAAFVLLLLGVGMRGLTRADNWPLAPIFLASLAGFATVGLFDSLVDVPRLATLYYLICFTLLVVRPTQLRHEDPGAGRRRQS